MLGAKTSDETFEELLVAKLPDSRKQNPVPYLKFVFPKASVRLVHFEILELWGHGGGLQLFEVHSGKPNFFLNIH